jgi:hypothetical protein
MAHPDRKAERPTLNPSELYRPRLGAQRQPLSRTIMSEMRAWREATAQSSDADSKRSGQVA